MSYLVEKDLFSLASTSTSFIQNCSFIFLLFICFCKRESVSWGGTEREREREGWGETEDLKWSREPDMGLELRNLAIMT